MIVMFIIESSMMILLYVDDMLIAAKNLSKVDKWKAQLKKEFEKKRFESTKEDFENGNSQE